MIVWQSKVGDRVAFAQSSIAGKKTACNTMFSYPFFSNPFIEPFAWHHGVEELPRERLGIVEAFTGIGRI
jgi:hypothetical protein